MTTSALPFDGLTVLVTGEVEGFSRHTANAAVERLGGQPVASVSGKTGLVVIGEGAGISKMLKVRTLGLRVIDGTDFANLATNPATWDGTPVGEPIAVWDARNEPAAEPEPVDTTPMAERHLVGKFVYRPRAEQPGVLPPAQARMWCQCGHRWVTTDTMAPLACPHDTATLDRSGGIEPMPEPVPGTVLDPVPDAEDLDDFDDFDVVSAGPKHQPEPGPVAARPAGDW